MARRLAAKKSWNARYKWPTMDELQDILSYCKGHYMRKINPDFNKFIM